MSSRVTRSMSSSAEQAPAQDTNTAKGKLRGRRRPTRGGKTAAAAGQLAPVREGDLNAAAGQLALGRAGDMAVAAGQPVLVGGGETAGDGRVEKGAPGESGIIAGPQVGHHGQGAVVSGPDHPLPSIGRDDRATQAISWRRSSNGSPLLWLTFSLALVAVFLAFLAPLAVSWHQSAKTASSLAEFGDELQHLLNQTSILAGRVDQIEERAIAAESPGTSQINWLSWDLGARAITRLSTPAIALPPRTPTTVAKPWWCPWCKERYIFSSSAWYESRLFSGVGPDAALLPHTEYEPPYCTSTNMQLAAKLPRPIVPTELVIEHWPKDEVAIAGIAPKEVELWVEHGEEWVLAGKWIYNIHANQAAQGFSIAPADLIVQRVQIRIKSNWGNASKTCLVRAKLYGLDKSGIKERLLEE